MLRDSGDLLRAGIAIDLACGVGQNSLWLARHGYQTIGVDVSTVALRAARAEAARRGLWRHSLFVQADLDSWRPAPASANVLTVFRFLDRALFPAIQACLRPGGLLFYETRHTGICRRLPDATRAYLLQPGELRHVFARWEIVFYEEGSENARLIARRPEA